MSLGWCASILVHLHQTEDQLYLLDKCKKIKNKKFNATIIKFCTSELTNVLRNSGSPQIGVVTNGTSGGAGLATVILKRKKTNKN